MQIKSGFRVFFRYCMLSVLAMLGTSCYVLADTYFISKGMGLNGLTALNLCIPVYGILQGLGLMIGVGGATKFSIDQARGAREGMNQVFSQAVMFGLAVSAAFFLLGVWGAKPVAVLLGANAEVLEMTVTYLKVLLLFSPSFVMNLVLECFLRNDGNPHLVTGALLFGNFFNIILDYILIFPLHMGIFGAILATGVSSVISGILMLFHFRRAANTLHFHWTMPSIRKFREELALGAPSLVAQMSTGVVVIVFNLLILHLEGNTGIAAYGVVTNVSIVMVCIMTGIAQGVQPLMSRCYGLGSEEGVRQMLRYAMGCAILFSLVLYGVIYLFAQPIAGVFNSEGSLAMELLAVPGEKLYFLCTLPTGVNLVLGTYFTSIEETKPAHWLSLLRGFLLIIPLAVVMAFAAGMTGIWLTYPIAEGVVMALGIFIYHQNAVKRTRS